MQRVTEQRVGHLNFAVRKGKVLYTLKKIQMVSRDIALLSLKFGAR